MKYFDEQKVKEVTGEVWFNTVVQLYLRFFFLYPFKHTKDYKDFIGTQQYLPWHNVCFPELKFKKAEKRFCSSKNRSSHREVFLRKGVLKICSKFTEYTCLSAISIKLFTTLLKSHLTWVLFCKFSARLFLGTPLGRRGAVSEKINILIIIFFDLV